MLSSQLVQTKLTYYYEDFLELVKDIWDFLKVRKKYDCSLIITIILIGSLIIFLEAQLCTFYIFNILEIGLYLVFLI